MAYRDEIAIRRFGVRLRQIRQSRGLSQEQLALRCGLEYSQVNRIELGKVNTSISHIILLAQHLEIHPSLFFTE